ncbi:MAG: hypothetical protein DKM50_06800 [Candidatus Margulisiibacteriota bacterium]|nr:MAG: hypothetical protein DKM50_06800 [Candidatus Margulisiibacteriota bacterium]HCY35677.1 hypothetical protein [Candidatus Margulisiibacteriota bacterium]
MKKEWFIGFVAGAVLLMAGCGQLNKQHMDTDITAPALATQCTEKVIASTNVKMKLNPAGPGGMRVLSVSEEVTTKTIEIGGNVPNFGQFYVTGNITFNVTAQSWTEADGYIMYAINYNDLTSEDLERVYVRAYMLDTDGLRGKVVTSSVLPLQVKAYNNFSYTNLTGTALTMNTWEKPFSNVIDHMQPLKFRADFTNALSQEYGGTIVFELVRVENVDDDTTPPGMPSSFTVASTANAAGIQTVTLGWINPTDLDFAGVEIRRSITGYPQSVSDGISIYSGSSSSKVDANNISSQTTYYYSIFAKDNNNNWSSAATASVTPYLDSYTKLLLHMDGGSIDDSSLANQTINVNGSVTQVSSPAHWGNIGSFSSPNYLSVADSEDWNFAADDFTIDGWVYPNNLSNYSTDVYSSRFTICTQGTGYGAFSLFMYKDNNVIYLIFTASTSGTTWDINTGYVTVNITENSWNHIAAVRNGNAFSLYVNGLQVGSATSSGTIINSTAVLNIGKYSNPPNNDYRYAKGYIDEFRISKGISRWTGSTFDVPTAPY